MKGVTVRPMVSSELEAVILLWHETCAATYVYIPAEQSRTVDDRRRFFNDRIAATCSLWVAVHDDDDVVGFLALRDSYVDRIYVHPSAQRRGVGAALLAQARTLSPSGLELHTHQANLGARAFYHKHDFREVQLGLSPPPEILPDVECHWRPAIGSPDTST